MTLLINNFLIIDERRIKSTILTLEVKLTSRSIEGHFKEIV